ncbi:MAG: chloride channel protein [Clostridia bacterium]|nr:chloride channel protein [Clostridia bacterium]
MKYKHFIEIKNSLIPCLLLSALTGLLTGFLIFLFKLCASSVISLSETVYSFVRHHLLFLPILLLGSAGIAFLAAMILKKAPSCRGGGIPTTIAILRGLIPFRWIQSIFHLFASAMLTYLGGVPLGNEGPSVQMGTAVGRGTIRLFAKKRPALDAFVMTGGASAGFTAATGAPLSGIVFSFEETHRRFSPMMFISIVTAALTSHISIRALCHGVGISPTLFELPVPAVLPLKYLWSALLVGFLCALFAVFFTKIYRLVFTFLNKTKKSIPLWIKFITVFVLVALVGIISADFLGTGHDLTEEMLHGNGVWYWILICLLVKAILVILANNVGVTGGLFVPYLCFGAMIGALCGKALIFLQLLPEEYYIVLVITGMVAFLSAASRTPLTALLFAVEVLCSLSNLLPIAIGILVAYLMIELLHIPDLSATIIQTKVEKIHQGKKPTVVEANLVVAKDAFIVGKELSEILWPPTCVLLSITKKDRKTLEIAEDDIVHLHYQTYDNEDTLRHLEAIVGKQNGIPDLILHQQEKNDVIPDIE